MHDNTCWRCYYVRLPIAVIATIGVLVPAFWCWYSVDDKHWCWCIYLGAVLSVLSTTGSFPLAFWRWYFMNDYDYDWQRWFSLRSMIAVFTTVWFSLLSFWCCWYFMNYDHHFGGNYLRAAAAVFEEGSLFSTAWRWYYDRSNNQEQCLYRLTSAIAWLSAIGLYLAAFRCSYCMNDGDNSWRFLEIFAAAVLSTHGSLLVCWLWFGLVEENQQSGLLLRSRITERTIAFWLYLFFPLHYWYNREGDQHWWYYLRSSVTLLSTFGIFLRAFWSWYYITRWCWMNEHE